MEIKKDVKKSSSIPQYFATITVDLLALSFGLALGWTATAIPVLQSEDGPIDSGPISNQDCSWLAALLCFAAIFATPFYCYCSLRFSRKVLGYLTAAPFIVGAFLLVFSTSIRVIFASRVFLGIGSCGTFIFCPVYVSEIAEDGIRGSLGVIIMLMRNAGILLAYVIGTYLPFNAVSWLCVVPPLVFALVFFWLPETPVYLLRHDRHKEADRALRWLRGGESDVTGELLRMKTALKATCTESSVCTSVAEIFSTRGNVKALIIVVVLCINQQVNGFYAIVSYTVTIFQESGSSFSPNTSSIVVGLMLVLGTLLSAICCDRVGRKVLLLVSDVVMAISLSALGCYFFLKQQGEDVSGVNWIPVTCLSVFVIALNVGLSPIHMLVTTEIFSPKLRSVAVSITGPTAWISSFLVAKLYPDVADAIGVHGCYWLFSVCCVLGTMFIIAAVPETRNRPLQAILEELEGKNVLVKSGENFKKLLYIPARTKSSEQTETCESA